MSFAQNESQDSSYLLFELITFNETDPNNTSIQYIHKDSIYKTLENVEKYDVSYPEVEIERDSLNRIKEEICLNDDGDFIRIINRYNKIGLLIFQTVEWAELNTDIGIYGYYYEDIHYQYDEQNQLIEIQTFEPDFETDRLTKKCVVIH